MENIIHENENNIVSLLSPSLIYSTTNKCKITITEPNEPNWNTLCWEEIIISDITLPTFEELLESFVHDDYDNDITLRDCVTPGTSNGEIMHRIVPYYQINSNENYLYKCKFKSTGIVEKVMILRKDEASRQIIMAITNTCIIFGEEFNRIKFDDMSKITYIKKILFQYVKLRHGFTYATVEDEVLGEHLMFNNNSFFVSDDVDHSIIQAFCHWTNQVSNGELIVVSAHGVFRQETNEFLLIDPTIHSKPGFTYGPTDLGRNGIEAFFSVHKCNDSCVKLGLLPIDKKSLRLNNRNLF